MAGASRRRAADDGCARSDSTSRRRASSPAHTSRGNAGRGSPSRARACDIAARSAARAQASWRSWPAIVPHSNELVIECLSVVIQSQEQASASGGPELDIAVRRNLIPAVSRRSQRCMDVAPHWEVLVMVELRRPISRPGRRSSSLPRLPRWHHQMSAKPRWSPAV